MVLSYGCLCCLMRHQMGFAEQLTDDAARVAFMRDVCRVFAEAAPGDAGPVLDTHFFALHDRYGVERPDYTAVKRRYDDMFLALAPRLRLEIAAAPDPLAMAFKLARAGNYIDFGAFHHVDDAELKRLIEGAAADTLNAVEWAHLTRDLKGARQLTYLTDNCGELVLDMLAIEALKARYPALEITAVVRGADVGNDASMADARAVGLTDLVPVIPNGNAVAGTHLPSLSPEAHRAVTAADLVLSKGMGNLETLGNCGLNVYYLFLCKCRHFADRFRVPLLTGMLVNDLRMDV